MSFVTRRGMPRAPRRFARGFANFGTPIEGNGGLFPGVKRLTELVVDRGQGSQIFTTDNKRFLDITAGIGVVSTGHCHPKVVAAVREQAGKITHAQQSVVINSIMLDLIKRLRPVLPAGLDTAFFCNSGGEAIESALRLVRQATGKDTVISFFGGYHGRTSGALAVTTSSMTYRGMRSGPLPGGSAFVPYPYEYAGFSAEATLKALDVALLQQAPLSDVAAVIIEPVLGEGGYVVPPAGFMRALGEWCSSRGILLIADEVQCGFGRTGKMWAVDHEGVAPDVLVSAKGIASGYPLAAVFTKQEIAATQSANSLGGTYGGNAVACAAALATMDVFESEGILENVNARGAQLRQGLRLIDKAFDGPLFGDIRGVGLMIGVEFEPGAAKHYGLSTTVATAVSKACFDRNMLLLPTGHRDTLRFVPPLVITEAEVDECLHIVQDAIHEVTKSDVVRGAVHQESREATSHVSSSAGGTA